MSNEVLIAILSLIGTVAGSITGIMVSNRLSIYRIDQLEKKLDRYVDNVDEMRERLVIVEQRTKSAHYRIDDIAQQLKITEHRKED